MNKFSVITGAPAFTKGYVKEFRVRWALEEMGLSYEELRHTLKEMKGNDYLRHQPFGQVPMFMDDEVSMFESGAIVLYLAEKSDVLMSKDVAKRARTMSWIFAALNSIEPPVAHLVVIDLFAKGEEWAKLRRPKAIENLDQRLGQLAQWLGDKDYLESEFSAGDLMMTTVLRDIYEPSFFTKYPTLKNYVKRNEARPAFKRAMESHSKLYE